jgi:Domain of unknown function (DUF4426)
MPDRKAAPWVAGNNRAEPRESPQITRLSAISALQARRAVLSAALLLGAACGGGGGPAPEAPPFGDPGFSDAGAWRMHYALTMTPDLPAEIAGSYGIVQRRNLALLTVTLAPRNAGAAGPPVAPMAEAKSVALTGERTALPLARRDEAGNPTWLASLEVRHRVPVTIEIRARATPESPEMRARLTREFRLD